MIDVHCHLEQEDYSKDRDKVVEKCKKELKAVITCCVHPEDFDLTMDLVEQYKNFVFATTSIHPEFIKEIISFIVRIPDKIKRAFYVKEISNKYGLYESDLRDALEQSTKTYRREISIKYSSSDNLSASSKNIKKGSQIQKIESDLIELFINGTPEAIEYLVYNVELDFIENETVYNIISKFLDEFMNEGKIDIAKITNELDDESAKQIISEKSIPRYFLSENEETDNHTLIYSVTKKNIDYLKAAKDIIKKFKIDRIRKEIEELKKEGEYEKIRQKQIEIKEIQKSED